MSSQVTSQPVPQQLSDMLNSVFEVANQHRASDIHLRPGEPVRLRVGDQLVAARATIVQDADILALRERIRKKRARLART